MFSPKSTHKTFLALLLALVLSALGHLFFPEFYGAFRPFGLIYLRVLTLLSIPIVFIAVMTSIFKLNDLTQLSKKTGHILLYVLVSSSIAILTGILIGQFFPYKFDVMTISYSSPSLWVEHMPSLTTIMTNLVPNNLIQVLQSGEILTVVLLSFFIGIAALSNHHQGGSFGAVVSELNKVLLYLSSGISKSAPIGLFLLFSLHDYSQNTLSFLSAYSLTVISGLVFHAAIVIPLIGTLLGSSSLYSLVRQVKLPLLIGFATASSTITLPITIEQLFHKTDLPKPFASLMIAIGTTINMNGTALYQAIATCFLARYYNIQLGVGALAVLFLVIFVVSIGTAAIPGGGLMTLLIILSVVNVPVDAVGYIVLVDMLLDRCRTTVNIWTNICGVRFLTLVK